MLQEKKAFQYYLFSSSNFIAAFGGGMILGKGVSVINTPLLQGGSLLAFLLGTVLGLIFLQMIPKKISKPFARWFSICGAFVSLILLEIFEKWAVDGKLAGIFAYIFFGMLSIRFGFWFYSRVLRAASVAGQQQRIAWVELGYYSGIILGLIIWKFPGTEIGITTALMIDVFVQLFSGFIDLYASKLLLPKSEKNLAVEQNVMAINDNTPSLDVKIWGWRLAMAVVLLTIGVQVIIFNIAHHVSEYLNSFILAAFYSGVAFAAFICKKFKIFIEWKSTNFNNLGYAIICSEKSGKKKEINFLVLGFLVAVCVVIAILDSNYSVSANLDGSILLLAIVFAAAFFYEILALAIMDRIGLEEHHCNSDGMVIRTYGLMGIGAVTSLWLLELTKSSLMGLIFTLALCVTLTTLAIRKRNYLDSQTFNFVIAE